MAHTHITQDNADSFIGAVVEFNWGAMHGTSEPYTVTSVKRSRWGIELIAHNEVGAEKAISSFTDVGIGAYLLQLAEV